VPLGVKDTEAVRLSPMRVGSRAYRRLWAPTDAPQVKAMRAMGAVLAGKTATSELAIMPTVDTDLGPATGNPWDPAVTPGGSSGGSAAAVAAGLVPLATGGDGGGSIRIPAALCHLYGFKASRGLTPDFYARLDLCGVAVLGCLSHTVDDTAAFLDAMCGRPTLGQPGSLLDAARQPPPTGLRIKLLLDSPMCAVDPAITEGVRELARLLEDLGHHIIEAPSPPGSLDEFLPIYQRLSVAAPVLSESSLQPVTRWLREAGRDVTTEQARGRVKRFGDRILDWFGDADLALTPTVPCFAPENGAWAHLPPDQHFARAADLGAFTAVINCSGQPAASVPLGLGGPRRLPFGAQLVGPLGGDVRVLQVSRQLEQALDWRQRQSPLFDA
jgi:amidase